ncbi:hypothetical protein Droror1_Dr00006079 [Drosera rotundifolia]
MDECRKEHLIHLHSLPHPLTLSRSIVMAELSSLCSIKPMPKLTLYNHQPSPSRFRPLPPFPFSLFCRTSPGLVPKPLVFASISSSPPPPPPPRMDIVSFSECADGSIVFGFGEVRESEAGVDEEDDVVEELEMNESGVSGLCLNSVAQNECVEIDFGVGAVERSVEETDDSDLDRTATSLNAVIGLGFVEGQSEYLDSGNDNANGSGLGSVKEKDRDTIAVGFRDHVNDVATGLEIDGTVEDEKEVDPIEAFDGMSFVDMANSMLGSELGVVTEVREGPDRNIVEKINDRTPNAELLHLSSRVEDVRDDEDLISTMPGSLVAEQIPDPMEDCLTNEKSRSLNSEMEIGNAPSISLEAPDGSKGNGAVPQEVPVEPCVLSSGAALLPHPAKALTGLEDAYFLTQWNLFGVADGAAQWSFDGIDRGGYASELMRSCETVASSEENDVLIDVKEILKKSAAAAKSPGLAAFLVARLNNQALHVANIGDTGFCVIRNGCVYYRSIPMVHEFNFPVRIGQDDDPMEVLEEFHVDIEDGDVIVVATDGLFDNLYEQETVSIVSESAAAGVTSEEIAKLLAARAQEVGRSASTRSPFADAAKAMGYTGYSGGKLDAVSVIVSLVQRRTTSSE